MKILGLFGWVAIAIMLVLFFVFYSQIEEGPGSFYSLHNRSNSGLAASCAMALSSYFITYFIIAMVRIKHPFPRMTSLISAIVCVCFFGVNTVGAIDFSMGRFPDLMVLWALTIITVMLGLAFTAKARPPMVLSYPKGRYFMQGGLFFLGITFGMFLYTQAEYRLLQPSTDLFVRAGLIGATIGLFYTAWLMVGIFRVKQPSNTIFSIVGLVISAIFIGLNLMASTSPFYGNFSWMQFVWMGYIVIIGFVLWKGLQAANNKQPNSGIANDEVLDDGQMLSS